jgi:hypothetical protein
MRCLARSAQDCRAEPRFSPWPMHALRARASSAPSFVPSVPCAAGFGVQRTRKGCVARPVREARAYIHSRCSCASWRSIAKPARCRAAGGGRCAGPSAGCAPIGGRLARRRDSPHCIGFCNAIPFCQLVGELSAGACRTQQLHCVEQRVEWLAREDKRIVVHSKPYHGSWQNWIEF